MSAGQRSLWGGGLVCRRAYIMTNTSAYLGLVGLGEGPVMLQSCSSHAFVGKDCTWIRLGSDLDQTCLDQSFSLPRRVDR